MNANRETTTFRVQIPSLSIIKTLTFDSSVLVYDMVLAIRADVEELSQEGGLGTHFKLYKPAHEYKDGLWLVGSRCLKDLLLPSGVLLEFKSPIGDQKVKLMDGKVNTFPLDGSFPVHELIESFCKRIGFGNPSDYALCIDIEHDGDTLDKKFDTFWLNDYQTLRQQNVMPTDVIAFRRRFYNDNRNISKDDRQAIAKVFGEISEAIITGRLPVSQTEAMTCAAVIAQITLGDGGQNTKIDWKQFVPKEYHKKEVLKEVSERYSRLQGLDEKMAKYRFIVEAKGLKHYGFKFFKVLEKIEGGKWTKEKFVYLGVNPDIVIRVDYTTKEVISRWPLSKVCRFAASASDFSMDFGTWAHKLYNCCTMEAALLSDAIGVFYRSIQKCRYAFEELGNIKELFTTCTGVEDLEPEVNLTPKVKFGPVKLSRGEVKMTTDQHSSQEELDELVEKTVSEAGEFLQLVQAPGELIQLPEDISDISDSRLVSTVDIIAQTIIRSCIAISAESENINFQAVKQMVLTLSRQVPELMRDMRTLARHQEVMGRSPTRLAKAALDVGTKYAPFMECLSSQCTKDFIEVRRCAADLALSCLGCEGALLHPSDDDDEDDPNAALKTLLMREARDLSGRVMKGVYQLKEQCARCLTSINQEELNRRASRLVNLAVQHYILTSVIAKFVPREGDMSALLNELTVSVTKCMSQFDVFEKKASMEEEDLYVFA